ncbi:MAG: hypothetical protein GX256_07720 [Fretibacterium sp.]|nr:hypothetical protein [Fretibacterium sp.]
MGFKPAYKSTMSDERRKELAREMSIAMKSGNMDLAREIAMKAPMPLPLANVLKQDWGIKRLREAGFNLDDAVAAYGKEWLQD